MPAKNWKVQPGLEQTGRPNIGSRIQMRRMKSWKSLMFTNSGVWNLVGTNPEWQRRNHLNILTDNSADSRSSVLDLLFSAETCQWKHYAINSPKVQGRRDLFVPNDRKGGYQSSQGDRGRGCDTYAGRWRGRPGCRQPLHGFFRCR